MYILTDSEYTTWDGALESDWGEPWMEKEIFQTAAIKVDQDFNEVAAFNVLTLPKLNPLLSDLSISLTGISQERLDSEGLQFPETYKRYLEFCDNASLPIICMSGDEKVVRRNLEIHDLKNEFNNGFHRLMPFVQEQGVDLKALGYSSGDLHKLTRYPLEGMTHDALHDVRSMASWLRQAKEDGVFISVSQLTTQMPTRDHRASPA